MKNAFFCLLLSSAALTANDFQLHPKERPIVIVTPASPAESVALAAAELAEHFGLATGVTPPIVKEGDKIPENAFSFRLKTDPAPNASLEFAHAFWKCTEDYFLIYGNDESAINQKPFESQGTLMAVYEWLDQFLGCRWIWPGDLGRVVPKTDSIKLTTGEGIYKPSLECAYWREGDMHPELWFSKENHDQFMRLQYQWMKRNRLFLNKEVQYYPHGFENWYDRHYEKHPDFFPMLPNGERRPNPYYYNGEHYLTCMCVSNPELAKQVVKEWLENYNPDIPQINLNENDTAGYCCCDSCLAWDDSPIPAETRRARAKERFDAGDPNWIDELGSVTNRYAKFYMRVLEEADRVAPEKHAKIAGLIYGNYYQPPSIQMTPRVYQRYCPPLMFPWRADKIKNYKDDWASWADTGCQMMLRPNFTLDGHCFPITYAWHYTEIFRFGFERKMFGVDMDSCTGNFGGNSLTMYAIPRIICHPEMTDEDIFSEYLSAFGSAAPEMRRYWKRLEELTNMFNLDSVLADNNILVGGNWGNFFTYAHAVLTRDVFKELFGILDAAAALAKDEDLPARRIEWLRLGLQQANLASLTTLALNEYKKSGNIAVYANAIRELTEFRKLHEADNLSNTGYLRIQEKWHWPSQEFAILQSTPISSQNPVNLLAPDWGRNIQFGTFDSGNETRLPFTLTATGKSETSTYGGVWGRHYQKVKVTPGNVYEFKLRYKTQPGAEGHPAVWLSATEKEGTGNGRIHWDLPNTDGEMRTISLKIFPEIDTLSIYLTWLEGTGSVEFLDAGLY